MELHWMLMYYYCSMMSQWVVDHVVVEDDSIQNDSMLMIDLRLNLLQEQSIDWDDVIYVKKDHQMVEKKQLNGRNGMLILLMEKDIVIKKIFPLEQMLKDDSLVLLINSLIFNLSPPVDQLTFFIFSFLFGSCSKKKQTGRS